MLENCIRIVALGIPLVLATVFGELFSKRARPCWRRLLWGYCFHHSTNNKVGTRKRKDELPHAIVAIIVLGTGIAGIVTTITIDVHNFVLFFENKNQTTC